MLEVVPQLRGATVPGGTVNLYVCGITPYDATHLGHARTYLTFDYLVRFLRATGREVVYAQNNTDIDDPLLERAERDGVDWRDLAAAETDRFRADMTALRVVPPDYYLGVVETIPLVGDAVRRLLDAGAAYPITSADLPASAPDIYAALQADTAFSPPADALAVFAERGGDPGRRGKLSPLDPALWRAQRPKEPAWECAGLPAGRPGWHIECAAIAEHAFGSAPTITGGGNDLAFPHHPMQTSHLRMLGHPEGAHTMHVGMLGYDGEKMSKSRGNLVFVRNLPPMELRLALGSLPWAEDLEWRDSMIADAHARLTRWRDAARVTAAGEGAHGTTRGSDLAAAIAARLADSLDIPGALRAVDAWAERILVSAGAPGDVDLGAPADVAAIDALLGIRL